MGKNYTRFVKYHEINVAETDLFEDAFGFSFQFHDVLEVLSKVSIQPGKRVDSRFMKCIRDEISKV